MSNKCSVAIDLVPRGALSIYGCDQDSQPLVFLSPNKELVPTQKQSPVRFGVPMTPATGQTLFEIAKIVDELEDKSTDKFNCVLAVRKNDDESIEVGFTASFTSKEAVKPNKITMPEAKIPLVQLEQRRWELITRALERLEVEVGEPLKMSNLKFHDEDKILTITYDKAKFLSV